MPATRASFSRHVNVQAQSQGTVKSLLSAVLTEFHFSPDLMLDSPGRVIPPKHSLHVHYSPTEMEVNSSQWPQHSESQI